MIKQLLILSKICAVCSPILANIPSPYPQPMQANHRLFFSLQEEQNHLQYIQTYSALAVEEMEYTGIPASITLAQGLLESAAGTSVLATQHFNHFGIKCNGSELQTNPRNILMECIAIPTKEYINGIDKTILANFRKYATVRDSYRDHSQFLTTRVNYKDLFSIPIDDYQSWARGLQKAGYATDQNYANKLIDVIQRYRLYEYDQKKESSTTNKEDLVKEQAAAYDGAMQSNSQSIDADLKTIEEYKQEKIQCEQLKRLQWEEMNAKIIDLENKIAVLEQLIKKYEENIEALKAAKYLKQTGFAKDPLGNKMDELNQQYRAQLEFFPVTHKDGAQTFVINGTRATSLENQKSMLEIANKYNLPLADLLEYNDMKEDNLEYLPKGCYIFLSPKAESHGTDKNLIHVLSAGQTLHTVSQKYGVKLSKLQQRNRLKAQEEPASNEFIYINKERSEKPQIQDKQKGNFDAGGR